jgi:phenylpyruvate tautomerase PptA (4-oxalocrotonate tautomerase family)
MQADMPFVEIQANRKPEDGEDALLAAVSKLASKALSKPEAYVMTRWVSPSPMTFAGSTEPCAMVRVELVGSASPSARAQLAESLSGLLNKSAGIPSGRIFVNFTEVAPSHWAMGGSLFG